MHLALYRRKRTCLSAPSSESIIVVGNYLGLFFFKFLTAVGSSNLYLMAAPALTITLLRCHRSSAACDYSGNRKLMVYGYSRCPTKCLCIDEIAQFTLTMCAEDDSRT